MADIENTVPTEHYEMQSERKYGEFATKFQFGSNPSAEIWNGRLAMVGFLALLAEIVSGHGPLHLVGIL